MGMVLLNPGRITPAGRHRGDTRRPMPDHGCFATLIWQIADLLHGPCRPPRYERVMLPMTVLRRFDCVLAPTKAKVLAEYGRRKARPRGEALDRRLVAVAGQRFHNHSPLVAQHLASYAQGFSANVRRIFDYFEAEIEKIGTCVWIVTNRKAERRRGRIRLLDARGLRTAGGSPESRRGLGDKRRHLSAAQILSVPPLSEQRRVVAFLKDERKKLDGLQAVAVRTMELLKERRAALIAAAVTGRINVGAAS